MYTYIIKTILAIITLTYLGLWILLEHRPCTYFLQHILSWAILSSCSQLSPVAWCLPQVTSPDVFGLPLFRVPWGFHVKACLVMLLQCIGLSQCVAKPSPSFLNNVYLYSNLLCSIPEVLVAYFVHPQYSRYFPQALIYKSLDPFQCGLVHSPRFCSV